MRASVLFRWIRWAKLFLLPILYPRRCPVCRHTLPYGRLICTPCEKKLPYVREPVCYSCGKPIAKSEDEYCHDCRIFPKSFRAGRALFLYNEVVHPAMIAFKYKNRGTLSQFFAAAIRDRHRDILLSWNIEAIVPVPIHKNKRKKRGYNQAELLAKELSYLLNLPCYSHLLLRVIDTLPQKQFSPQARLNNLTDAFCINKECLTRIPPLSSVLLIDDIYTTGSTMEVCARTLAASGIRRVYIYSVCIGESRL